MTVEEIDVQALHDSKWTETKVGTKHGEKPIEKRHRPPDFGENECDDLEYDEESVEDGPKDASRLIGHRAVAIKKSVSIVLGRGKKKDVRDVVTIELNSRAGRVGSASCDEIIDCLDVVSQGHDATRKHEQACDDRENANAVQAYEYI